MGVHHAQHETDTDIHPGLSAAILTGCGSGGDNTRTATGTQSLSLTDSSTTRYKAVYVTISEVQVNKDDGSGNGNIDFSVDLPQGTYDVVASGEGLVPDTASSVQISVPGQTIEVDLSVIPAE